MIFAASSLLIHFEHFGPFRGAHFGLWPGHFFSPFFIFLGLLFLFAILRRRDQWGGNSGGGYGQGQPYVPPPPPVDQQHQGQQPGNYANPYTGYGDPGVPTRVDANANPGGGASTIRMDPPAQGGGEPTRALNVEQWSEQARVQPPEDDTTEHPQH
jgi:hypothetical protein